MQQSPPQPPLLLSRTRDSRIDCFRGAALLIIFVLHINPNVFKKILPVAFGFSDGGEVFVFLSGYVAGLVYWDLARSSGYRYLTAKVAERCFQIYCAHIVTLFACLLLASKAGLGWTHPMVRAGLFLTDPATALEWTLALCYFPWTFDILPLYLVVLPTLPVAMWFRARAGLWALLAVSFALYAAVQIWPGRVVLPGLWGQAWYFNPFAWQFLFYLGVGLSTSPAMATASWRWTKALTWIAAGVLLFAAVLKVGYTAIVHPAFFQDLYAIVWEGDGRALPHTLSHQLPGTAKSVLQPVRLVYFLALVFFCRTLLPTGPKWNSALLRPLIRCGRNSLTVFCFGSLTVYTANAILATGAPGLALQFAVTVAGVSVILCFGSAWDWLKMKPGRVGAKRTEEGPPSDSTSQSPGFATTALLAVGERR
jgi:hypothetical protein